VAGYSNPAYLTSLAEFGKPVWLPNSGCGILVEPIPGTSLFDARGPYPLFSCECWSACEQDLKTQVPEAVSFVGVVDPLQAPEEAELKELFPDQCKKYKEHFLVNFDRPYVGPVADGHRRNLVRGLRAVQLEKLQRPIEELDAWWRLYDGLNQTKGIRGISAFSRKSFELQLALPELRAFRALKDGRNVAMCLWLIDGDHAYYHLGASSEEGYGCRAMFALFDSALRSFQKDGIRTVLLGAGAGVWRASSDGLSRFKAGWANETRTAYLCGKILHRTAYESLSKGKERSYFPAYRSPNEPQLAIASTSPSTI
jgi:hypothetical protein